ncbi:MAG: hypothetical protein O2912_10500, partial [Proteobacteria bacterium]|nr:hypothetical protein [Pseudomonadota bacterium]
MLHQEMLLQDYMVYVTWAGGAIFGLAGLALSRLRVLIIVGIAIPLVGLPTLQAQKAALSFEVTIVESAVESAVESDKDAEVQKGIKWRTVRDFRGGTYSFKNGEVVAIARPDAGGWKGTVVINQSTKPLIIYVIP